jgi:hypothetical protein
VVNFQGSEVAQQRTGLGLPRLEQQGKTHFEFFMDRLAFVANNYVLTPEEYETLIEKDEVSS